MSDTLIVERADGVMTITLNRPDAMNALSRELLEALTVALESLADDRENSVVILQGAGRCFSAGVDLKYLKDIEPEAGRISGLLGDLADRIVASMRDCPIPVIAKVHGFCFTGALELALHCDLLYTTVDTKFGDTHAKFGIRPTWGMSQNLPLYAGLRRAKELAYTARTFSGADAASWGLANDAAVDKDALDALVAARAAEIAANSRETVIAYKDLHRIYESEPVAQGLKTELERDYPAITDTGARLAQFKGG